MCITIHQNPLEFPVDQWNTWRFVQTTGIVRTCWGIGEGKEFLHRSCRNSVNLSFFLLAKHFAFPLTFQQFKDLNKKKRFSLLSALLRLNKAYIWIQRQETAKRADDESLCPYAHMHNVWKSIVISTGNGSNSTVVEYFCWVLSSLKSNRDSWSENIRRLLHLPCSSGWSVYKYASHRKTMLWFFFCVWVWSLDPTFLTPTVSSCPLSPNRCPYDNGDRETMKDEAFPQTCQPISVHSWFI